MYDEDSKRYLSYAAFGLTEESRLVSLNAQQLQRFLQVIQQDKLTFKSLIRGVFSSLSTDLRNSHQNRSLYWLGGRGQNPLLIAPTSLLKKTGSVELSFSDFRNPIATAFRSDAQIGIVQDGKWVSLRVFLTQP